MAVHIRLARHGSKKAPYYRIVVTDQRNPRDGRFIERIGTFNPAVENALSLDSERYSHWLGVGAKASDTLQRLVRQHQKSGAAG